MADTTDYLTDFKSYIDTNWRDVSPYIAQPTLVIRKDHKTWSKNMKNKPFIQFNEYQTISEEKVGEDITQMVIEIPIEIWISDSGTGATDKLNLQNYKNEIEYILNNFNPSANGAKEAECVHHELIASNGKDVGMKLIIHELIARDFSS